MEENQTLSPKESFTSTADLTNVSQHFYNVTQNIQSNVSVPEEYGDFEEIERWINICVRPVIVVLGTIGNMLAFFVMRRGSLKEVSTCFYMAILALTDTGKSSHYNKLHANLYNWVCFEINTDVNVIFLNYKDTIISITENVNILYFSRLF